MAKTRGKKTTGNQKGLRDLPAKKLTSARAAKVKGGGLGNAALLPAVQKVDTSIGMGDGSVRNLGSFNSQKV